MALTKANKVDEGKNIDRDPTDASQQSYNSTGGQYTSIDTAMERDQLFNDIENASSGYRIRHHKSFDFSNVALFADNDGYEPTGKDNANFRRFHQMTMYIQVPAMYRHHNEYTTAGETIILSSNLPEKVSYSINNNWVAPLNFGNATTNLLMQMAGPKVNKNLTSTMSRATTMKIWNGTDPLTLNLTIPVIDDGGTNSRTNLVEALEVLGSISLPRRGGAGFYVPPPNPLTATIKYASEFDEGKPVHNDDDNISFSAGNVYGRIMLQLGGILLIDKCVIEGFTVNYPNTKAMIRHDYLVNGTQLEDFGVTGSYYLHPLLAEVTIRISTIEAMTADTYSYMLWGQSQKHMGSGYFDASTGVLGTMSAALVSGYNKVKKVVSDVIGNGTEGAITAQPTTPAPAS